MANSVCCTLTVKYNIVLAILAPILTKGSISFLNLLHDVAKLLFGLHVRFLKEKLVIYSSHRMASYMFF